MPLAPETPAITAPQCAGCGQPSACAVWETPVCYFCFASVDVELPTSGEVEKRLGLALSDPDYLAKSGAEFRRVVKAWVPKRRAAMRAHLAVVKP